MSTWEELAARTARAAPCGLNVSARGQAANVTRQLRKPDRFRNER
jgi:hypothetical protein